MERVMIVIVGVIAAYLVGVIAAVLTRLLKSLGARINATELGARTAIDDLLVREAFATVADVEVTFVDAAKRASATGSLTREDANEALTMARGRLVKRVADLGAEGLYSAQDLNALVEYALRSMGLTGDTATEERRAKASVEAVGAAGKPAA